ncbi:hypothetical protein [Parapedobacter sp. 10938]|uniref:hypothetical protein n=1 Tax=Parapedobacter flavus TaxID=3110225 RepID=UPI002DBF4FCD|nr:hypothetical protein [Parapedobacter sp. 10938]MEC3880823.1 hypothetical protein [Parapedobacter sp. 10938]
MTTNMETITTKHPLRTITLRYDRSKEAPEFEIETLQCYHEIHDRTYDMLQRVQQGRKLVPRFRYRIEGIERLLEQATYKFDHLKRMIATNPVRDTVYGQLKALLADLESTLDVLVPELIDATKVYIDYEEYGIATDEWMEETAFPQFHEIFSKHEDCSVDVVLFDLELEDFRHELAFVKKQERLYLDEMSTLVDDFTVLSDSVQDLFEAAGDFTSFV